MKSIKINPEILKETTKAADNGEPLKGRISIGVHGDINKLFFKPKDTDTGEFIAVAFSEYGNKLASAKGSTENEAKNNVKNEMTHLRRTTDTKHYKWIVTGKTMDEINSKLNNMKH